MNIQSSQTFNKRCYWFAYKIMDTRYSIKVVNKKFVLSYDAYENKLLCGQFITSLWFNQVFPTSYALRFYIIESDENASYEDIHTIFTLNYNIVKNAMKNGKDEGHCSTNYDTYSCDTNAYKDKKTYTVYLFKCGNTVLQNIYTKQEMMMNCENDLRSKNGYKESKNITFELMNSETYRIELYQKPYSIKNMCECEYDGSRSGSSGNSTNSNSDNTYSIKTILDYNGCLSMVLSSRAIMQETESGSGEGRTESMSMSVKTPPKKNCLLLTTPSFSYI